MKKLVITLLLSIFLFSPITIFASGVETNQDNNTNQVKLNNNGDIIFLSTTVNEAEEGTINILGNTIHLSNQAINPPTGFAKDFVSLLNAVLSFVMVLSALLVFFYLIMGAFNWITSGGDKGKLEQARSKITAAVIGLVIVSASFAILTLLLRFLGFSDLNDVLDNMATISGDQKPKIEVMSYTDVCGGEFSSQTGITKCDQGCDALEGSCQSDEKYVVKFTCEGKLNECKDNQTEFDTQQSIAKTECNKTIQINVFDKDCAIGDNEWNCNEDNLKDYLVWYSGECDN